MTADMGGPIVLRSSRFGSTKPAVASEEWGRGWWCWWCYNGPGCDVGPRQEEWRAIDC